MALRKYDPFDVADLPTGMRLFQDAVNRLLEPGATRPWTPPVDILENENALVLKADVPEVDLSDIDIQMENGTLAIKGERKFEAPKGEGEGYHGIERSYGAFARYFTLPETVEVDKIRADYKNGVLTVTMPKKEVAKPRSIKVEVHE